MIKLRGVNKFFNRGRENEIHVVNDLSLELSESGMVAIFGKSGCGKTTLLNLIGGLDFAQKGEILVGGEDISKNTDTQRNKYIGYVFQNYNLSRGETCYDNVAAALRLCGMKDEEEIKKRVFASLRCVGMENYAKRLPDTLSGGQQQRIAIARAIVKNPPVILADEPTGNLDSANTVMIMDLLKKISREHLVILVTHEENLVDYYCDRVIELSDGKVTSDRINPSASGLKKRDKNDIFLGELDRIEYENENAVVEYYGDAPASPIKLKIINSGGRMFLKLESETVQFIDESSEIKLREGVFEEEKSDSPFGERLDLSELPPVKSERCGRLFSLKASIKSGYRENFKKEKRGKRALRRCMALFSAVVVFMSALFGTAFRDIKEADGSYNHNVFYLYTPDGAVSDKLTSADENASGIDYIRLVNATPSGDQSIYFHTGSFETFKDNYFSSSFGTNAVFLDDSLAEDLTLIAGKRELKDGEILITSKVADELVDLSTLGYIKKREDLIGLISLMMVNGRSVSIAGIVDSNESAVYFNELTMAKYTYSSVVGTSLVKLASDYGISLNDGECILAIRSARENVLYPKENGELKINGLSLTVKEIRKGSENYSAWLLENGIEKLDGHYEYFLAEIKEENPAITEGSALEAMVEERMNERYFEFYDYYYSEIDEYLNDIYFFQRGEFYLWLYFEKDVEKAKYGLLPEEYYQALCYKNANGRYPTKDEFNAVRYDLPLIINDLAEYENLYAEEFYRYSYNSPNIYSSVYLLSENDYINASKRLGETDPSAKADDEYIYVKDIAIDESITVYEGSYYYTLIHSSDPEKTAAFLAESFADLQSPYDYMPTVLTPDDIRQNTIRDSVEKILKNLLTLVIVLTLMCLCMYFIMRSALMKRVKEVGIMRAIGVSKRNLTFKFFIESAVIATLTVCVGFLISSGFIALCSASSSLVSEIFYYPLWLCLSVFVLVNSMAILFGILPLLLLLRRTPSEILSKYDI